MWEWGPMKLLKHRASKVRELAELVKKFDGPDKQLLDKLSYTPKKILKGKRMGLWKFLLQHYECPDVCIVDEMMAGCRLTGIGTCSKLFPSGFQSAIIPPDELRKQCDWIRRQVVSSCRASVDAKDDLDCWQQTMQEVEDGWMEGPFVDQQSVSEYIGTDKWLCGRRFPLRQGDKIRLIDDAKQSKVNQSYYSSNKLALQDVDTLIALASQMTKVFAKAGEFHLRCSDGSVVAGKLADDWQGRVELVGRTLDLSSAYKQLPTSDDEPWTRVITVFCPATGRPQFFVSSSLPFGCTSAVYSFNRAAKGLWFLMQRIFKVIGINYFDDYPTIEPSSTANSARICQEALLRAIGWRFASEGKKALDFNSRFDVLGVTVDLQKACAGSFEVCNKESRVLKVLTQLDEMLDRKRVTQAEAAQIHGVLNFAQGQYLGRVLQPAMRFFQKISLGGWKEADLKALAEVSTFLVAALNVTPARTISISDSEIPILLFTDGACEPRGSKLELSAGIVVKDEVSGLFSTHEVVIPERVKEAWEKTGKLHLIAACELFPVLVAWRNFAHVFANRRVLVFIDNSSVKTALAKGASKQIELFAMLICLEQARFPTLVWYPRVPSKSNCADDPSRGKGARMAASLRSSLGAPLTIDKDTEDFLAVAISYPELLSKLTEVWNSAESCASV